MTKSFAEMTYDEQRAALGLGDGPPRGYALHRARVRHVQFVRQSQAARERIVAAANAFADAAARLSLATTPKDTNR